MMELYFTIKTIGTIAGFVILVGYILFAIWMLHKRK